MKKGLLLVLFLALIPAVSAQIYYSPYISWPVGVLGGFNFANIYDSYAVYIDAIIFLLIFLGLGKLVFGLKEGREREEPGYKLLYIGLALLMTISLLLLESRMRFTLLGLFGPWVSFILLMILTYAGYAIASEFIKNKWIVFGITLASFLFFLDSFYIYFNGLSFLGEFIRSLFSSGNHRLLYFLALLLIVIGAIRALKLNASKPSEGGAEGAGPSPRYGGAEPSEPVEAGREAPRSRELPAEVIASLQEKDRLITQLREQITALSGAGEALNTKIQDAIESDRADLAEKMAAQAREYAERIARIKNRRRDVLRNVAESFNQKLKELEAKIAAQKIEYESLLKELREAKAEGDEEAERKLMQQANQALEEIENRKKSAAAVKEEIERLFAEGHAVGVTEKFDWEKEKEKFGYLETEIMRPKPTPLLPTPITQPQKEIFTEEEIQQALTEEEKIKPGIKKIDLILKEISKKRKFFEDIERETFLLRLFTKKGMPRSNLLSEKFLDTLQDYLDKLDRSFDLYLRLAKKEGKGKYAEAISAFKEAYKKERLNFVEVQKYKAVRKEVRSFINYLNKRYPEIGEIVSRRLKKPTDLSSEIRNFIDHDNSLNDKERELLHTNVDKIDNAITTYSNVLSVFFNALAKCREPAEVILALRS